MLKIKLVNITYDGTTYVQALPFDDIDLRNIAVKDPGVDGLFASNNPRYDLSADGFKIYPKFTSAQVTAGAAVYVEWYRAPRDFATTGTDSYVPGFDLQFHKLPALGAAYDYCKLYKPDTANRLMIDLYGNNANIKGMLKELEDWYSAKSPTTNQLKMRHRSPR